jgi:hypothetical protein
MSQAVTPFKAMQGILARLPARPCQRCFTSSALQPKPMRPVVPRSNMQSRQPIVQRRTKYKTVEQAKSRYSRGVRDQHLFPPLSAERLGGLVGEFTDEMTNSPFPGEPASSLW